MTRPLPDLYPHRAWARDWLFSAALPLWWEKGADHACGGWYDKLDQSANPLELPKRLRVQARQTFVYAEAGRARRCNTASISCSPGSSVTTGSIAQR